MKIREGFVSNSSSSSFIFRIRDSRHFGDTVGTIHTCYGYLAEKHHIDQLFTNEEWRNKGRDCFEDLGLYHEYGECSDSYFFGVKAEGLTETEARQCILNKFQMGQEQCDLFKHTPELFIIGDVGE